MAQNKIIIIGGGIAGPALALFLKRKGMRPTIYEARSQRDLGGGGIGLAMNGMRIMRELGLASEVKKHGANYSGFRFYSNRGSLLVEFEDQITAETDIRAVAVRRSDIHEILIEELLKEGIEIHFEKKLKGIEQNTHGATCLFEDGTKAEAGIVVAADGLNSRIRNLVLPEAPQPEYTGLLAFGGFIPQEKVPHQYLPVTNRMHLFFGEAGFFGISRCGNFNGRSYLMWWNATPVAESDRKEIQAMTDKEKKSFLLKIHRGWHEPVEKIITETDDGIFADNIYDIQSLPTWSQGNVVLMGDAAHAVSPHSGQGASMALEDAWRLSEALYKFKDQPKKAFEEFEEKRRNRVERVVQYGRQSQASKKRLGPIGAWMRNRFLALAMPSIARSYSKWMYHHNVLKD